MNLHVVPNVLGNLRQVFFILFGNDGLGDPGAQCRQQLLFQAANGKHLATQRDFTGHGNVTAYWDLAQRAGNRRGHSRGGA